MDINRNFDIETIIRSESLDVADGIYFPLHETKPCGVFRNADHDRLAGMEDNSWWFRHRNRVIEAGLHTFRDVLERGKFEVEYCAYFFSLLSPVIFMFRRLPYLLGKRNVSKAPESESIRGLVVASTISKFAEKFFAYEISKINRGIPISHGASIFAVAKKRGSNDPF